MMTSMFSKQDLLKTFVPLSESGKAFLEIMMINPATHKVEGRGFFNDTDFLLEACNPLVGRFNFCLSNFAYPPDRLPSRASYNQFDRSLLDAGLQDHARAHSISVMMLFKPELIREMSAQAGSGDQFLNIIYQIDGIMGRFNIKSFSLDYFLTGMVLRFWPAGALQQRPLNKAALAVVTKRFLESLNKEMSPQEHKRFALGSAMMGKMFDPMPGLPGQFAGENGERLIVSSSGSMEPSEDAPFISLFEEVFDAKPPAKAPVKESYTAPNIQGLSQNWEDSQPYGSGATGPSQGLVLDKGFGAEKESAFPELKSREGSPDLINYFVSASIGKWRWPLCSAQFNKIYQGVTCGDLVLLQCDPFASEIGFHYLMQCAEGFSKEGTGQIVVFSKKRSAGDLALASLSRHYKTNPLQPKPQTKTPDPDALAAAYDSLFPHPPQNPACGRGDGLDQLLKYLEHDYLLTQKKRGQTLMPLAIVIDNLDEFHRESEAETYKSLAQFKLKLKEINGTLWVTQLTPPGGAASQAYQSLADYLIDLDHDGSREAALSPASAGGARRAPRPSEWEASFHLDLSAGKLLQEISLTKIRFQAHGSHRAMHSHMVYYRTCCMFKEINPPQAAAAGTNQQAAGTAAQGASMMQSGAIMQGGAAQLG